jgi:hypothetical protein
MEGWAGCKKDKRKKAREVSTRFLYNGRLYISFKQEVTQRSASYTKLSDETNTSR